MRFLAIATLILLTTQINAQISLDQAYENVDGDIYNFGIIAIDSNEYKYLNINIYSGFFELYNLDHSLYEVVDLPDQGSEISYTIYYITRTLFDCDDSNIEYLVSYGCPGPGCGISYTTVLRTDGTEIFHADSLMAASGSAGGVRQFNFPIYSTPLGTKMKLININNSEPSVSIFSICGDLPGANQFLGIGSTGLDDFNSPNLLNAYPVPSDDQITIPYNIGAGLNHGQIEILDNQGRVIEQYRVGRVFDSLTIDVSSYSSGTYFYRIRTENGIDASKQFIVID